MTTLNYPPSRLSVLEPAELYAELLTEQPLFILDVRNELEYARHRIRGRYPIPTLNIPYFAFIEDEESAVAQVPTDQLLTVICAKEGSSQYVAELLAARGIATRYLRGGFQAWLDFYDVRDVVNASWGRIVQIIRPARGDLSYVIISAGEAAVVDPGRHIHLYQGVVAAAHADITRVLLTHLAAGRLSGGAALASESRALLAMHPYDALHPRILSPTHFTYVPLPGGERLPLGQLLIEAHWFPGHTPGHLVYRVISPMGDRFLLTGDALLLNGCGRTDLGGHAQEWTALLLRSLQDVLPTLVDDQTLILPSTFLSLAETRSDGVVAAPFAVLRAQHPALQVDSAASLLPMVTTRSSELPAAVDTFWRVNLGLQHLTDEEACELEVAPSWCGLSEY